MIAGSGTIVGTVQTTADVPGTIVGTVSTAAPDYTIIGDVDRERIDSYDASTSVLFGARVELNGEDVTADLIGPVTRETSIDSPFRRVKLTLNGARWGPHVTELTWTRVGEVAVYWRQGPPGGVLEEVKLVGIVETCSPAGDRAWTLDVVDQGYRYAGTTICFELPPFAGSTRGQVARALALAAGIASTDIPDGEAITKPISLSGRSVYDVLEELGEVEGWHWRTRDDGTLETYTADVVRPPAAPHHRWHVSEMVEPPKITPPRAVPSRWVVRGTSAVSVDELGQTIERVDLIVEGEYAPLLAAATQAAGTGTITPTGFTSTLAFREISRVTTETTKRGSLVVRQETREKRWYNPASAKWNTQTGGAGSAPGGFDYLDAYIDPDGKYRAWIAEKYVETGRRVEDFRYDSAGTLTREDVTTWTYMRRTHGVRHASTTPPAIDILDAYVGDDDVSYSTRSESYRQSSSQVVTHEYQANGAERRVTTDNYGFRAIKGAVDSTFTTHYVLSDGSGQIEITANYRLFERLVVDNIIDASGRLSGEVKTTYEYAATEASVGVAPYDWGKFSAYVSVENFRLSRRESRAINVSGEDSYAVVSYDDQGRRTEENFAGSPPVPRYLNSPFKVLSQTNIEAVIDDQTIETWFGPRSEVVEHPLIQTEAEALALILRRLRRRLAFTIDVRRPETAAVEGETVLVIDPNQRLAVRGVIVEISGERMPGGLASYKLEAPLL